MTLHCVAMCHEPYWGKVHSMLFGRSSSSYVLNLRLRSRHFIRFNQSYSNCGRVPMWLLTKVMGIPRWNCYSSYHVDFWSSRHENKPHSVFLLKSIFMGSSCSWSNSSHKKGQTIAFKGKYRYHNLLLTMGIFWSNSFSINLLRMCPHAKYLDTQGTLLDANPFK
jgi:hypothetical protein